MEIGTNFHFFGAGVYKDMKLSSTPFFTRNDIYREDDNDWDSGLASTMAQDAAGYPLEVPFPHPDNGNAQIVAFTIGGYEQSYETGTYVMLFDGVGTFNFVNWTAATVTSVAAGRIEFTIDVVDGNGVHIEMMSSQLGNHVRNIRIVRDIYESDYLTAPFLPQFAAKADEFGTFRFMDWAATNYHPISAWGDRIDANFHTQANDPEGMSWEFMIDVANYFDKDIWINVPHLADANYITQMAMLFRDRLETERSIYLEYSNECWNWIFDQTHWLNDNPPFTGNIGQNYGYYSLQVFDTWETVFSGQENRLKMVLAGHDYFVIDAMDYIIAQGEGDLVDLVSYPGYVALSDPTDYDALDALSASATADDVMDMLEANMASNFYWMNQFKILVSDVYGKEFTMYEGGQHLTPRWFGLEADYNPALYAAQNSTRMYSFYQDILDYYKNTLGVTLFMNYTLTSPQESAFGSWGLLENYFSTPNSQKWNAIMDWRAANTCTTADADLAIKIYLQGAYNSSTGLMNDHLRANNLIALNDPYGRDKAITDMNILNTTGSNAIVDWVDVELRHVDSPNIVRHRTAALLQRDGDVVDVDGVSGIVFPNVSVGDYHVSIRHRNHLGTMTNTAVLSIP